MTYWNAATMTAFVGESGSFLVQIPQLTYPYKKVGVWVERGEGGGIRVSFQQGLIIILLTK